jgi:hypothetical protein
MRRVVCLVMAAAPWGMACGASPSPSGSRAGYWNESCLSGDGRFLLAGGDHAALVDTATGTIVERRPGAVRAVGCDGTGGVVAGHETAVRLPGQTTTPVPTIPGDRVLARTPQGAWISGGRTISGGRWRGPASLYVTPRQDGRADLLPERFGAVGAARRLPTPDTFAVRFGSLLGDGRVLLAAGWQPSQNSGDVEDVPWGFFGWDLQKGEAWPLTRPLASDARLNQAWVQRIAATPDAAHLVIATHDGERLSIGWFERDASRPSRVVSLASKGAASALALRKDGTLLALGSESRGRESPAQAWLLDAAGRVAWNGSFEKTVAGVHFLPDGSMIVAAGEAKAVRVKAP